MGRIQHLEDLIRESHSIICEHEEILQTSYRPEERLRSQRAMDRQWILIEQYLQELSALADYELPPDIAPIAARFVVRPRDAAYTDSSTDEITTEQVQALAKHRQSILGLVEGARRAGFIPATLLDKLQAAKQQEEVKEDLYWQTVKRVGQLTSQAQRWHRTSDADGIVPPRSHQADIRLEVLESRFDPSYELSRHPFPGIARSDEQGLPGWGSLQTGIKFANSGYEEGEWDCGLDEAQTVLPSLFDTAATETTWARIPPSRIGARDWSHGLVWIDFPITEKEPHTFAQALKALLQSEQQYQVVLRYRTRSVDGESKWRELNITIDLKGFCQKVIEYWEAHGLRDLAELACAD